MKDFMNLITVFLSYLVGVLFITIVVGVPIMWLWNWLMPTIFGLSKITFGQSLGLVLLAHLLLPGINVSSSN